MRILFIDTCHPILIEKLIKAGNICDADYISSKEDIEKKIAQYDGIVIRSRIKIDKQFLINASKLKFIARAGAGLENIDTKFAALQNITCINAPEGNSTAVAEHALAMLLMLFTKLNIANYDIRNGIWQREQNRGIELTEKTIGIIGFGNTGSAFAKCLLGFDCNILVYDKYKTVEKAPNIKQVDLLTLQKNAEVISLHVPYNEETHYYINDAFINYCKNGLYIINTSRGKCLNTLDLINHLKTEKVKGACLDVFEYESSSFENINNENSIALTYLINSNKTILSPHIAGWTIESNNKIANILCKKIFELQKTNLTQL